MYLRPPLKFQTLQFPVIQFLAVLLSAGSVFAQSPAADTSLARMLLLEDLLALSEDEQSIDEEDLAILQSLVSRPLNLNDASFSALIRIPLLDAGEARAIVAWRETNGPFVAIEDLVNVLPRTSTALRILQLILFVDTRPSPPLRRAPSFSASIIQGYGRRFDLPVGYARPVESGGFSGSPAALYTRLDADLSNRLTLKVAMEKDAGETFSWQPAAGKPGFDHLTGSLAYTGAQHIKTFVIGDYALQFGEGLLFWRNTARGKGTQPVDGPIKRSKGIKPSASREENAFFRGSAASFQPFKFLEAGAFYSKRSLDATLYPDADSSHLYLGARQTSGLHRTATEQRHRDAFKERILGGMLNFRFPVVDLDMTAYTSSFSNPYIAGNNPANLFDFAGQKLAGFEVNTTVRLPGLLSSTAFAHSIPGGIALTSAFHVRMHKRLDLVLQWRRFQKNFYSFHGNAFAEHNTGLRNETGYYLGGKIELNPAWTSSFFVDFYHSPWLRTTNARPVAGLETFNQIQYNPRKWLGLRIQYRRKLSESNTSLLDTSRLIRSTASNIREALSIRFDYEFSSRFKIRSRFDARKEITRTSKPRGTMLLQDLFWHPFPDTQIQLRFSLFNSDGRGGTMYAYEHDVRYRFTIKSFTGTGMRNFILLRKRVGTLLTVEVKYGTTRYGRITNKGTGADFFSGKLVREMNLQILFHT